jgi:hypothetical protein
MAALGWLLNLDFAASDAVVYELTAESASYSVTAQDATLTADRTLSADSASYSVTAQDATPAHGRFINADSASYTVTGTATTLDRTYVIVAESAPYTVTGTSATFSTTAAVDTGATGGWEDYAYLNPPTREELRAMRTVRAVAERQVEKAQTDIKEGRQPQTRRQRTRELKRELRREEIPWTPSLSDELDRQRDQAITEQIRSQLINQGLADDEARLVEMAQAQAAEEEAVLMLLFSL